MDIQQSERTSINLRERKISPLSLSLYLSLYLSLHFQTCGRKPLNYCPRVQYVVRYIGNEELVLVTNNFEYDIHFFLFCPLQNLVPQYALCLRDGEKVTIKAQDLTIGDVIEVKFGDRVPADIRVIESRGFKVIEDLLRNAAGTSIAKYTNSLLCFSLDCPSLKKICIFLSVCESDAFLGYLRAT